MSKTTKSTPTLGKPFVRLLSTCIILQIALIAPAVAMADQHGRNDGVIDEARPSTARADGTDIKKQVKKEQRELAKQNRNQLKNKAEKGERLAQVALGGDFASEAQMLTFAPAAANNALSDAVRWYTLAAKRGFPGAPSLDASGVSFYPIRVVRGR